ncbi:MAG TPA: hypothetical protein VGF95_15345 [Solirubrobacteraceae bacterium]
MLLTVLGMAGIGALAPAAQAQAGPQWFVAGSVLKGGSTVEAFGMAELVEIEALEAPEAIGGTLACRLKWAGEIIGGAPGADLESTTLPECELEHVPSCEINGQPGGLASISLGLLETTLVYLNGGHTEVGDLYKPHKQPFATITLGTHCPIKTTVELEGSMLAQVTTGVKKYLTDQDQEFLPTGTKYEVWNGSTFVPEVTELELGANTAQITGSVGMELVTNPVKLEFMVE